MLLNSMILHLLWRRLIKHCVGSSEESGAGFPSGLSMPSSRGEPMGPFGVTIHGLGGELFLGK